ncbi:uncharacterized protein Z518_06469 [Rhinocladiella mackenziei CBS 650.93]|uniref:Xylanolytic transcriptional activator regulatory domain-containing protein n=1 Tax=Rhinocladiella mackenziei CBS 650.93 TaxID=1442369 RepID=A0A0D2FU14_9EURO|nr:uncharacterized protein Z518_06469 [Rhinocladiella mackenziei CBS 650.93]KIX05597.1 hypothetical protein Z518_06469 [Rhinocladiella mackenziei CBS 650.93]
MPRASSRDFGVQIAALVGSSAGKFKIENRSSVQQLTEIRPHVRKPRRRFQGRTENDILCSSQRHDLETDCPEADTRPILVQPTSVEPTPTAFSAESSAAPHSSFLGRSSYITSTDLAVDEEDAMQYKSPQAKSTENLAELQSSMLRAASSICIPPQSLQLSLIKSFMERGAPWMPIVEPNELEQLRCHKSDSLLATAVFVAGSKLSAAPNALIWGEKCYFYTKCLLFHGTGHGILHSIIATILLHWWNPSGPEHVSLDSSSLWLRISVGIAHQAGLHREPEPHLPDAGLRRRLWWTLIARDNQISTSHGRPRALRLEDSNVRPLQLDDFRGTNEFDALLFMHFVRITSIVGDITEHCRCGGLSERRRLSIELELLRWIKDVPPALSLFDKVTQTPRTYNFKLRQLYVPFFVALIIFYRGDTTGQQFSATSLLAASFVSGIFEEYIAWADIMFLAPASIFYLLVAGLIQVSSYRYPELAKNNETEISTVRVSLKELGKRFPTAHGAERIFENLLARSQRRGRASQRFSVRLSAIQKELFQPFDHHLCASWPLVFGSLDGRNPDTNQLPRNNGGITQRDPTLDDEMESEPLAGANAGPGQYTHAEVNLADSGPDFLQPVDALGDYTLGGLDFWWPDWTELNH